ncbi:V-type proton ATPase subunit H-like isoform X1 [Anneissia japonica]|uniref:V-type proton ATPase subunit H-like isoform X1 n=1 Tax=Anneissia japonica TaxID=1529436 RepID=UPI00142573D5|nr:V-type proton ATPase subunit H-like isoform X1 [Anneissia japonica]
MSYSKILEESTEENSEIGNASYGLPPTNKFDQEANEVRKNRVNWQSYVQSQMITQEEFEFIVQYNNQTSERRDEVIKQRGAACAKIFLSLINHIAREHTVRYLLTLIDDLLKEKPERASIFFENAKKSKGKTTAWSQFLNMLNREDKYTINQASRVITKLACCTRERMSGNDLKFYLSWIRSQLTFTGNEYMQTTALCLQQMLKHNEYRVAFVENDGLVTLLNVLSGKVSFQLQYQLTFCIWMLSFNPDLCGQINKHNVIPVLADILTETTKEKVSRIILAVFRNLAENPTEKEIKAENALSMIQCKVLKQLEVLEGQKIEDEDIIDDIEFLIKKLQMSVQDLSSFDEYSSEVKSGRLEWSPVHKSEKFWRENSSRLNEKNYELLKILTKLLETSKDPLILAVSAHDLGEYVRHYPRGKNVIEQLGGKQLVMQYMIHEDPNVRYEALLAVQKLMVHNWEYLGKTLQQGTS